MTIFNSDFLSSFFSSLFLFLKKIPFIALIFFVLGAMITEVNADEIPVDNLGLSAYSALLMDQETGTVLYEKNSHTPLPPASVTKIMTILLVMEALERGDIGKEDVVTVSENAAGMGGSQVYLKAGETMSVWELLKCVVVVSGNDASVALAEYVAGSEDVFVGQMNARALELGMHNTLFFNCTGLPQEGHSTTAFDIALMSQELLKKHPDIVELSTIWMDSIRDGEFGLSNTNRLIYSYSGATGLKTGSTDSALYCMSASASREGMDFIAVILKAPTSAERFDDATTLLDYGFATFSLEEIYPSTAVPPIQVNLGLEDYLQPQIEPVTLLLEKNQVSELTTTVHLPETLDAPIFEGDCLGTFDIFVSGVLERSVPIVASLEIPRLTLLGIFQNLCKTAMMGE